MRVLVAGPGIVGRAIVEALVGEHDVVVLDRRPCDVVTAPNDKAKRLLGWEPKHDFEFRPELEDWSQPDDPPPDALPEPGA